MPLPLFSIQARIGTSTDRILLVTGKSDTNLDSMTRILDEIVKTGWEKERVHEAWLYEDGDLAAYVHERAFQRPEEDEDTKRSAEKRPVRHRQRKVA